MSLNINLENAINIHDILCILKIKNVQYLYYIQGRKEEFCVG